MVMKWIKQVFSYLRESRKKSKRSPMWASVEKYFLASPTNQVCACCGSAKKLQVHHLHPFAVYPEKELEFNNLVPLCMENLCHLKLGHGGDFQCYNPFLLDDLKEIKAHPERMKKIFSRARDYRRPM